MNIEDIKIGETYNVRMHVSDYCDGIIFCSTVIGYDDKDGLQCGEEYEICHDEVDAFSPITPYTPLNLPIMTKIPETYHKYDPCRKFRKGDIVAPRIRDGRIPWGTLTSGSQIKLNENKRYIVLMDENRNNVRIDPIMGIMEIAHTKITVDACHLELVTPVEELEPYFIEESHDGATIVLTVRSIPNGEGIAFRYCPGWGGNVFHSEEQFRQHAEAERDCLNAEHRKELSNG